jgi:FHA domain-containing protein
VRLERDHLTIGRLASNDIALPYPHISRQHAELRLMGQTWWVVDLRSTNGLHVGGQRVSESRLALGALVMLSPLISITLVEDSAPAFTPSRAPAASQGYALPYGAPSQSPGYAQPHGPPSQSPGYAQPYGPPSYAPAPATYPSRQGPMTPIANQTPVTPLSALGPRSPFADDEAPFYPQMRQSSRPAYSAPPAYAAQRGYPAPQMPHPAAPRPADPIVGPGEMSSSALDPQRQVAHIFEQRRTAHVSPSPLLHVCQTCGQRTMPDAIYCQSCRHSIASECVRCRLSLLPIQDLCPRCQTPNPSSVRRLRPAGAPW